MREWRRAAALFGSAMAFAGLAACRTDAGRTRDPGLEGPTTTQEASPEAPGRYHEVKPGETVWEIARRNGLSVEELVEVNGLASAEELAAGQLLFIPVDPSAPPEEPVAPDALASTMTRPDAPVPPPAPITGDAPLMWPIADGVLLRDFEPEKKRGLPYEGILLATPAATPVSAAADGEVAFVGEQSPLLGRMVIIRHDGDLLTIYGHLDRVDVRVGDKARRGRVIGTVGTSGRAESPQLHFQVRRGRTPEDPLLFLPPP